MMALLLHKLQPAHTRSMFLAPTLALGAWNRSFPVGQRGAPLRPLRIDQAIEQRPQCRAPDPYRLLVRAPTTSTPCALLEPQRAQRMF
jgi:hypothetical protein